MYKIIILSIIIVCALAAPVEIEEKFEDYDMDVVDFEAEPIKLEIDIDEVFLDKVKRAAEPARRGRPTTERSYCGGRNGWC